VLPIRITCLMVKLNKTESRKYFSKQRDKISSSQLRNDSEKICEILFTHFNVEGKTISIFLPIERKKEINTYNILKKAISLGALVSIPKANFETLELTHYIFENADQLTISSFGIPEPKHGKTIGAHKMNIILVPLLAIDNKGYRVGYGKGFYDRFLKKTQPQTVTIGVSLFEPIDQIIDVDSDDIPLQFCITPRGIIRF